MASHTFWKRSPRVESFPQIIISLKNGLSHLAELFLIGCNCLFVILLLLIHSFNFSYRLRLLGRTPPSLGVEEQHAEKGAEKEEHTEKEEPRSTESDRSSKGVYHNSNFSSDINSTEWPTASWVPHLCYGIVERFWLFLRLECLNI